MLPKEFLQKFAADVSKRCGICQATVEQVLPACFDEIRYRLCEAKYPCVPIESFGTFAIVEIPERERRYTYKDTDEIRHYPPKQQLKFAPTRNTRREIQDHKFDQTRRSFIRHPADPPIRKRKNLQPNKIKTPIAIGRTTYFKNS